MSSKKPGLQPSLVNTLDLNFGIATSYLILGLFAQITTIPASHAAAIWPSAGIALAAVTLFGYSIWPGIFLGSFSISAWAFRFNSEFFAINLFVALSATVAALVAYTLILRLPSTTNRFLKNREIIQFLLLGGPLSCLISGTISPVVMYLYNVISLSELPLHWFVWWSGDSLGVIIFTPLTLILFAQPKTFWQQRKISVALPIFIIFLFFSVLYMFATKLAFYETVDLSKLTRFDSVNWLYIGLLLCGLCFAFVFVALLLILSGRYIRTEKIAAGKTSHFLNEINNRKKIEQALSIAIEKAESSNRAKSLFLKYLSHELRTPLNGIFGFTQLLQNQDSMSKVDKEKLNIIQSCANHLLKLIDDLLDIPKIESGKVEIVFEPFNFKCFLFDLMEVFKLKADEKNISFDVIYDKLPECINSDEKRLRQIFSNLLSNAINFTDQGNVTVTIKFIADQLHLKVTDTGCGIDKEDHEKIFKPFVQVNKPKITEKGSGLGLTITLELIKLLGGSIKIKSQLNQGSQFCVFIPLKTCDFVPTNLPQKRQMTGYKESKKSVWVVDDNKESAKLLEILVQELGFEVRTLTNGFQCLEWLEKSIPDLIFMDMTLPGLNGIETNRSILAKFPEQKIIGMSASVYKEDKQRFMDSGCLAFIEKPIQHDAITTCLSEVLDVSLTHDSEAESADKLTGTSILVAEDNEINSLLLENLLISLNCHVEIAQDGGQAIKKLLARPYKLALIDLQMPVLDGVDVVKQVRNQVGPNQKTKMVAVSAFAEKRKKVTVLKKGFDAYLTKPIELQQLEELISSL